MLTDPPQAADVQDPFLPRLTLERAFRYWWLVAVFVILGGLGGWIFSKTRPPLYEATAQFSIGVDFVSTGPLTQYEEDLAINSAGNLYEAADVLQSVVDQANAEGMQLTYDALRRQITLERKFSSWTLRVRDSDPENALRMAQIWSEKGQSLLLQSYQHAVQAYAIEQYLRAQEDCLAAVPLSEPPTTAAGCGKFVEIQENLRQAGAALNQEKLNSRGLFTGLTLGPFNPPVVSREPVTTGRNQAVLLGGLLGLITSIGWIEFGPKKYTRRS